MDWFNVPADYFPLIARTVARLDKNTHQDRIALYERARTALVAQLRGVTPALDESEITRERLALEEAIRKVEHEATRSSHHEVDGHRARATLPPATVIPEQSKQRAITFVATRTGPLDLVVDPPNDIHDAEQSELFARLVRQLTKLQETIPSQERGQIDDAISAFLDQPQQWRNIRYKKVLWLCGNALRNILAKHDAIKHQSDPHPERLPPAVAEALREPIETWNIVALFDPDLRELDIQRIGPQDAAATIHQLAQARPVVTAASDNRKITTESAGKALLATVHASDALPSNVHGDQVRELANLTSRNVIVQILRGAYGVAKDLRNPETEEARFLVAHYKQGLYQKLGEATIVGAGVTVAATAVGAWMYALPFFEFVATHSALIKGYLGATFQSTQLTQLIDAIEYTRDTLANDQDEEE